MTFLQKNSICFFNSNAAWGGGEKWHLTTAVEFKSQGHDVFIVANQNSELAQRAVKEKVDVIKMVVSNLSFLNIFKILSVVRMLRSRNVDTIILNLPSDLKLAGIAAKLSGVKNIIYRRGMPHPLRNTILNRFLFTKVLTNIVVNSEEIGRSLETGNWKWFPSNKLLLVYNGVDAGLTMKKDNILYSKTSGEFIIGNAGRLTEQKGQKYLIEMARVLKAKGFKFKLLIAGEGELKEQLIDQIAQNHLGEEVKLLGHVVDMESFFNSLDIFVFTSLYEGSANTLIETLQYGIPTVAFDVSSNPEIIQHNKNGYLAKPFDVEELSGYVQRVSGNPEIAKSFIAHGHEVLKEKFDSRRNLSKLLEVIR